MKRGKLYFLRRRDGLIKIGYSADFDRRISALTKSHGALEVVRLINGDKQREKRLHVAFRRFNEYGEWFRPEPDLLAAIASLEEGTAVGVVKGEVERDWLKGERAMAEEAASLLGRMVMTRRRRTGLKNMPAMRALADEYGLRWWSVQNLHMRRPSSVSAYTIKRLREALIAELTAAKEEALLEIAELHATEIAMVGDEKTARAR